MEQGLQKQATAQYEAVQRWSERFFKENAPSYEDNKPCPEGIIQWVRVQFSEEVLLTADYLFHVLGSTTPSLDAQTMDKLVLGHYQLAGSGQGRVGEISSTMGHHVFPSPLDLQPSIEYSPIKILREQNVDDSPRPTMVKDRRVTVEGHNLPCVQSNTAEVASVSQGTAGVASPALVSLPVRSLTNEGRSTLPPTGMSKMLGRVAPNQLEQ